MTIFQMQIVRGDLVHLANAQNVPQVRIVKGYSFLMSSTITGKILYQQVLHSKARQNFSLDADFLLKRFRQTKESTSESSDVGFHLSPSYQILDPRYLKSEASSIIYEIYTNFDFIGYRMKQFLVFIDLVGLVFIAVPYNCEKNIKYTEQSMLWTDLFY